MSKGNLVHIEPQELKYQFELMKKSYCYMTVKNKTDHYVAFKVKATQPKNYVVRPKIGVILPNGACDINVTMAAQKEAPPDMQIKDKFLVQNVIVPDGSTIYDLTSETFNKEDGKVVEEVKLNVVYIPHDNANEQTVSWLYTEACGKVAKFTGEKEWQYQRLKKDY